MTTWICTRTDELQHHGIKGQRWGIRRFQNKDGSLTPAGRRRYDEPNKGGKSNGERESKPQTKKPKEYAIPKNKSLHRLQLEEKYRKQGLSQEQAEQKAAKRIKTEAYVAAAAAVTVGACIAYTKHKGYTSDKVFKENTEFQRVMKLAENAEIREGRQYLAVDKKDKVKYKGMLAKQFDTQIKAQEKIDSVLGEYSGEKNINKIKERVYDVTVRNKGDINVASRKRAEDAFMKLYKEDSEFRKGLQERAKDLDGTMGTLNILGKDLSSGIEIKERRLRKYGYDYFNTLLVDNDERSIKNANKFYDALRKQGMNAIEDMNDKKYSGYNAKMPIITFDGKFDYSKRVMDATEILKNEKEVAKMITRPTLLKAGAMLVGVYGATPVANKIDMDKRVLKYKEEHPNTNMTNAEIKAMIKEEWAKAQEEDSR